MIEIRDDINELIDEVTGIRRYLHTIPELGFEEYKTSKYIKEYLENLDIEVFDNIATTGVLGYIEGKEGKRTIAFRADIDALPVFEETGVDFCSQEKGRMHACGHDGHTAILLALAKYLSLRKDTMVDNILLIFQPAEEGPGGAEVIIKEGILEKFSVDRIYGLHLYPDVDEGKIAVRPGPLMAMTGEFDINIYGKSGHGAIPQNTIDSIVIASNLVNSYQSIVSRNVNPVEPSVITIGRIEGGERRNVIAGKVTLEGTLRAFNENIYNNMKNRMISIAKGLEVGYDCKIDIVFRDMYPPVTNDLDLTEEFIDSIGNDGVEIIEPQMTAEDFSYYQQVVPGVFFFLGVGNEQKGYIHPLHSSKFNFDEKNLALGIQAYVDILVEIKSIKY